MNKEMVELAQRVERAEERATLLAVVSDMEKILPSQEPWQQQYLLKALFSSSKKLTKLLTISEVQSRISLLVSACDPLSSLLALNSNLSSGDASEATVFRLFAHIDGKLEEIFMKSLESTDDSKETDQWNDEAVGCLVSLRDRVTNFASRGKEEEKLRIREWMEGFEARLFSIVCSCLSHSLDRIQKGLSVNLKSISLLLTKGRNLQLKDASLLEHVVQWICGREESTLWDRISQRIFTDESHGVREFEALVTDTVLAVEDGRQLLRCLGYSIKSNACVRMVCTRRLLLQRVYHYKVPRVLAEYVALAGGVDFFAATFKVLMTAWADVGGVKFNPVEKQKYLTVGVLEFGRRMSDVGASSHWRELSQLMVNGVHERLGNSDLEIRHSGMFVAEMCSHWQEDQEKLNFDYEEDDWLRQMKRIVSGEKEPPKTLEQPIVKPSEPLPDLSKLAVQPPSEMDSDDEDEEFGGSFVPEKERNFERLKEGEEPERSHRPPNYIRDAMDWLEEKERYEKFEAALYAVEAMIRRKAVGFSDFAPRLALKLVHLEDRFSSKRFEEVRRSALVACLVMRPDLAPALGDVIFSRSSTFATRFLILNAFLLASKELAEPPKSGPTVTPKVEEIVDKSDWRQVVDARIRAKTRIISEKRAPVQERVNRFAPVATLFFYPLLRTSTEEHLQLRGKDAPFLAKLLFVAGEILQCAAASPSVVKMTSSLHNLVTPLRFHDEPSVRAAVLFCYFSIASAVPPRVLADVFGREAEGWLEWACAVADDVDLSAKDRGLGRHVAAVLVEKLRSAQER